MSDEIKKSPLQIRKEQEDASLAELETTLAELSAEERANYFFANKEPVHLKLVNLLSSRVDCIRNPADRKKFFMAHPELEVRYSAANFK